MKKTFLSFLFALPMTINAQVSDTSGIEWIKTTHDFNNIPYNVPATYTFKFVNRSKKVVSITSVEASCGCTQPTWSQNPIQPNDTAFVSATYRANSEGVFNKQVTVYVSTSSYPTFLKLQGTVIPQEHKDNDGHKH